MWTLVTILLSCSTLALAQDSRCLDCICKVRAFKGHIRVCEVTSKVHTYHSLTVFRLSLRATAKSAAKWTSALSRVGLTRSKRLTGKTAASRAVVCTDFKWSQYTQYTYSTVWYEHTRFIAPTVQSIIWFQIGRNVQTIRPALGMPTSILCPVIYTGLTASNLSASRYAMFYSRRGCIEAYMKRYKSKCSKSTKPLTCEQVSRLHNGGPEGCQKDTLSYLNKVKKCYN